MLKERPPSGRLNALPFKGSLGIGTFHPASLRSGVEQENWLLAVPGGVTLFDFSKRPEPLKHRPSPVEQEQIKPGSPPMLAPSFPSPTFLFEHIVMLDLPVHLLRQVCLCWCGMRYVALRPTLFGSFFVGRCQNPRPPICCSDDPHRLGVRRYPKPSPPPPSWFAIRPLLKGSRGGGLHVVQPWLVVGWWTDPRGQQ